MSHTADTVMPGAGGASVVDVARAGEPDRYLAALLAPPARREALLALAAFSAELAQIPLRIVHEPAMGEIRLQWWRDALALPPELRAGHPVADAVRRAAQSCALPAPLLAAPIDARSPLLYPAPPLSDDALRAALWGTDGALFALAAQVVGVPDGPQLQDACIAAGEAYGLVRRLLGLPRSLAQGRIPLAQSQLEAAKLSGGQLLRGGDAGGERLMAVCAAQIRGNLEAVRPFVARLSRPERVAFLPLALVEPYLRSLERLGPALVEAEAQVSPFKRVRRIAGVHLFGGL